VGTLIRPQVLRVFTERPGKIIYVDQIAEEVNASVRSIVSCVYNMRRSSPLLEQQIEVVIHGHAWRYTPSEDPTTVPTTTNGAGPSAGQPAAALIAPTTPTTPARTNVRPTTDATDDDLDGFAASAPEGPSARIFEELGADDDGRILVVDENGETYWLVPRSEKNTPDGAPTVGSE
jgi:hypothetical protein